MAGYGRPRPVCPATGKAKRVSALTLTYAELAAEVNRCANALRSLGLGKGDVVGLYMPMIPELAIAFLAIIKIGGIILPLFSGYGPGAIVARLADADAKALITADGLLRRGQKVAMKPVADQAVAEVPSIRHVVVVNRAGLPDTPWTHGPRPLVARTRPAAVRPTPRQNAPRPKTC